MVCGVCEDTQHEVKKIDGVAVVLKQHDERRTTDVLFLLLLLCAWVAMTSVGIVAAKTGNPDALISPYDANVRSACCFCNFCFYCCVSVCVSLPSCIFEKTFD